MKFFLFVCFLTTFVLTSRAEDATPNKGQDSDFVNDDPVAVGDVGAGVRGAQMAQAPAFGSSYVGYNQECAIILDSGPKCKPNLGLICDMRVCKCENSTTEPDLVNTWVPNAGKCQPIARSIDNWACEDDLQCRSSRMGRHSHCVYRSSTCECEDADGNRRPVTQVDDVCYIKKSGGDSCTSDLECAATIKGPAVCSGTTRSAGICGCAGANWYNAELNECLELGSNEESSCKLDKQCNSEMALGPLAKCNLETGKCQCWDTQNGDHVTGFYKTTGKCFYKKNVNEKCTYREECVVGYHRNADCLAHEAYNDEKACQCRSGESCTSGGGQVTFSILLLIISACFVKQF